MFAWNMKASYHKDKNQMPLIFLCFFFFGVLMSCSSQDPCNEPQMEVAAQQPVSAGSRLSGFQVAWPGRRREVVTHVTLMLARKLSVLPSGPKFHTVISQWGGFEVHTVLNTLGGQEGTHSLCSSHPVDSRFKQAKQVWLLFSCIIFSWNWLTAL